MAGNGGRRPGAGRPRGSRNRRTREAIAAAEQGVTPLNYLLQVMWDPKNDTAARLEAAKAAAPYVHPKLSSIEVQTDADVRTLTDEQIRRELADLLNDPELRRLLGTGGETH
jgi:hypothetical protein